MWVDDVEERGIAEVRKVPGYHDEPLKGERSGERSIRLNRSWRAIYVVRGDEILVKEVTHHVY
jgi:proteic killer suppression protein